MTVFTANKSFLPFGVDFTQILELKTGFSFKNNVNTVFDGATYQDVAAYRFGQVTNASAYFRGTGLTVSSADKLTGGTVTSLGFYTGAIDNLSSPDWNVTGITVAATKIAAIMASSSTDDDVAFFASLFTGNDRATLSADSDYFEGLGGNDVIFANAGDDAIFGNDGNDKLYGGLGDDDLYAGLGDDLLSGGAGNDTASYDEITKPLTINLSVKTPQVTGGAGKDTLASIENLYGGSASDKLTGNSRGNDLFGNDGNDVIKGLDGNDTLLGGRGKDTLTGGAGADKFGFHLEVAAASADKITDFSRAQGDKLVLSTYYFAALSGEPESVLAKGEFYAAAGATNAQDATDRIIYNTTTGGLYYDADGLGGKAAILFATLGTTTHPALAYTDILLGY